jgi:hypothetical protein
MLFFLMEVCIVVSYILTCIAKINFQRHYGEQQTN